MTVRDDFIAAALRDADEWQGRRDAIVQTAMTALIQAGSGVDVRAMRRVLAAAFEAAAEQEMAATGSSLVWASLMRTAARMGAP